MPLPKQCPGIICISSFTTAGEATPVRRGVTLSIYDDDRRIVVEAELPFEAFGKTVTAHSEVSCSIRTWKKA